MSDIRYDLIPPYGIEEVSKVLTNKLLKYNKNEWKHGLNWSDVLNSLKKHLNAFELGHDYEENNILNIAEVAADALILCEYYKIYPQGDDRCLPPLVKPIVAVDLDDTVFDFKKAYNERFKTNMSDYWKGDYNIEKNLEELQNDKEFWINLPVKNIPTFEVDYYVTARSIPIEWTEESIQKNNLPKAKIYSIPWDESKIDILKSLNCNIMIDDKYETFKECLNSKIFCYLMDAPHNRHYDVGHHRIYNLDLKIK